MKKEFKLHVTHHDSPLKHVDENLRGHIDTYVWLEDDTDKKNIKKFIIHISLEDVLSMIKAPDSAEGFRLKDQTFIVFPGSIEGFDACLKEVYGEAKRLRFISPDGVLYNAA